MPVVWTYVGAAIVIASALYIAHREHQLGARAAAGGRGGGQTADGLVWALSSQARARSRCVSVMCRRAAVKAATSTAASSVNPKPSRRSGTASKGRTK